MDFKILYIGVLVFCWWPMFTQVVTFSDLEFKAYLLNEVSVDTNGNGYADEFIDLNQDGEFQISEIETVTRLNIGLVVNEYVVTSVKDLAHFKNLTHLQITHLDSLKSFSELDLTNLTQLYIGTMYSMEYIDISDLENIENLRIEDIEGLDYLNIQNGSLAAEYFSLFYSEEINYACVDDINEEFEDVKSHMIEGNLPSIDCQTSIGHQKNINSPTLVFPNPVLGILNLESIHKPIRYEIQNITGHQIRAGLLFENQIDVSALDPGFYILNLENMPVEKVPFIKL